ncbi:xanthine dehydrogenase accessory factor [Amycolatopsis mediterranei S699]|uniref:Xanthine dehydrogenase accessory factor n=2 Tax=Amycolatopsis mediterranei TaxID=33910 RepID=A0A0H3D7W2_AMYMU|nr:XdhC family protein [Amycolatopsis mediterranei]ADJ47080.1 xanthine dehydrogenase accessory factor [Amycolatopsis mediterranei U32]AEK43895.1 xanthine dehydrogenase accessory factor [Amycolatopsis mediterranei S699]AFO78791.1 xanthine dehydrogenase accessory factor [Amycolatopsis mediterranei S699]AGT85919.1 xanthine dehydrogenase accessory factor [Amycolatopsis mediterranei RB]KDO04834.1 xanthine dehydrogenase [Amycolatopsis mediterranei]
MSETCDVAHGTAPADPGLRTLVAVFASPVSRYLLKFAKDLGYHVALFEPDAPRGTDVPEGFEAETTLPPLDASADVVVTDHHRPELGLVLKAALEGRPRWVGVLGNPRHPGPHVAALRGLGVPEDDIARVHRPVGLNIGSRTPPEIALATLAGLLADRNNRPGGFDFTT